MDTLLGTSPWVFLGVTVVLFGGAAFMMGEALAQTWRPIWHNVAYGILLGLADRFLVFALFKGELLSVTGFIVGTAVIVGLALVAYRLARARRMVTQYPWLYERAGPFAWRERS